MIVEVMVVSGRLGVAWHRSTCHQGAGFIYDTRVSGRGSCGRSKKSLLSMKSDDDGIKGSWRTSGERAQSMPEYRIESPEAGNHVAINGGSMNTRVIQMPGGGDPREDDHIDQWLKR